MLPGRLNDVACRITPPVGDDRVLSVSLRHRRHRQRPAPRFCADRVIELLELVASLLVGVVDAHSAPRIGYRRRVLLIHP